MILDGWGKGDHGHDDVVYSADPVYINGLEAKYPSAQLLTDGENVGLPDGQMGNSEVGHLNIGAGRVVYQDLVKINRACRDNSILKNPEIVKAFTYAKVNGKQVHFMGLLSDGGVHSSLDHLFKLCDISKEYGIDKTFVHCFMDGRDTDPRSGKGFVEKLQGHLKHSAGKIASVIGRYYAMDRDKRWERVKEAYDLIVKGVGEKATDAAAAVQKSYDEGVTDEFIKPIVCVDGQGDPVGTIQDRDVVIFFNFRNDRAKELTVVLTQEDMPDYDMKKLSLYYCCMTPYDAKFTGQRQRGQYDRRICIVAGPQSVAHRRNGEIRARDVFPERRPRRDFRRRGTDSDPFPESGYLRSATRDERLSGKGRSGRAVEQEKIRFHLPELRQRRHGGTYRRLRCDRQGGQSGGRLRARRGRGGEGERLRGRRYRRSR